MSVDPKDLIKTIMDDLQDRYEMVSDEVSADYQLKHCKL